MITVTIITAVFCFAVGVAVLRANPYRFSNQIFALIAVLMTLWLIFVYQAMRAGAAWEINHSAIPTLWLRANAVIVAFIPGIIWLLKESILAFDSEARRTFIHAVPWSILSAVLIALCLTESFAIGRSTNGLVIRGTSYFIFNILLASGFAVSFAQALWQLRAHVGIRRVELQFVIFTLGATGIFVPLLTTSGKLLNISALNRASIPVIFLCYAITAWAITFHRVFDARQVFIGLGQRALLALILTIGILGIWQIGERFLPPVVDLFVTVSICAPSAFWIDGKTREWLGLSDEAVLRDLRAATLAIARSEPDPERLVGKFETLLCERFQAPHSTFLFDRSHDHTSGLLALAKDRPGYSDLCLSGWATPENLQRRRPSAGVEDLRQFMGQHSLGVIVAVPQGSPTPSVLLALGVKTNRWPFTFPEVRRLQRVAELMDSSLIHARLIAQAALEAKMEHLAMMSRGLAHDLKNLITPISSFIVHTDGKFPADSAEGEVHSAAKRSVRMMTEYVRNALFFSNRLTPRFEPVELEKVFQALNESTRARAIQREVEISCEIGHAIQLTADVVLLQRLLGNLVHNAIDACNPGGKIAICCSQFEAGCVRLEVTDNGCGIAPEDLGRIFGPYFTTKKFGDDTRGFGLGLTVCEKIVNLHQGKIVVHSEFGSGTRVTVDLPAAPSAFAPSNAVIEASPSLPPVAETLA